MRESTLRLSFFYHNVNKVHSQSRKKGVSAAAVMQPGAEDSIA